MDVLLLFPALTTAAEMAVLDEEDLALATFKGRGDEIRALNCLRGSETSPVLLARALGLSSLSSNNKPVDSLFIDKAFGPLDPETLETALSVLVELQSQGCQVRSITHIDGLAMQIPVPMRMEKLGGGRSKVIFSSLGRVG